MAKKVEDKENLDLQEAEAEKSLEEIEQELLEVRAKKQAALPRCGHVNAHSRDLENELDALECELPETHLGKHKAPHTEWDKAPTVLSYNAKGVIKTPDFAGESHEVTAEWSDAAGEVYDAASAKPPEWTDGAPVIEFEDGTSAKMPWGQK